MLNWTVPKSGKRDYYAGTRGGIGRVSLFHFLVLLLLEAGSYEG